VTAGSDPRVSDYLSLDYNSARSALLRRFLSLTGKNLTNLPPQDPFCVFLDLLCYSTDLLAFTQNQHVREGVPVRSQRVSNFLDVTRGLGFSMREREGSTATISATLDPLVLASGNIVLTPAHKVATPGGVVFHPKETNTFLSAGPTSVTFEVEQGVRITDEVLSASSPGTPLLTYTLGYGPVIPSSILIEVGGVAWERTDAVALSEPTDIHYEISFDEFDVCTVKFGDGVNGRIPPTTQDILVSYRVGGGIESNVALNTITVRTDLPTGILTVTNAAAATGGWSQESLSVAKARLPRSIRANDRCVSVEDYAAVALEVGGIVKAFAESGVCGSGGCGKAVIVYAIPEGGTSGSGLTATQKSSILAAARANGIGGKKVLVRDPSYGLLALTVDVYVQPTALTSRVETSVSNILADRFDPESLDFDSSISIQEVYELLLPSVVEGIRRVQIMRMGVLPYLGSYLYAPPTGNGTLQYPSFDATSVRREWYFYCTSASAGFYEFSVKERVVYLPTEVTDTSIRDDEHNFAANLFAVPGEWLLRYQPYDPAETGTRTIAGNTSNTVSVLGSSLQDFVEPGDVVVVEKVTPVTCYAYQSSWTVPGGGYTSGTILYSPGSMFSSGMSVRVSSSTGVVVTTTITGGTTGAWTVSDSLPAYAAGVVLTVTVLNTLQGNTFALVAGSIAWVVGDVFYVDTYPYLDDIQLRGKVFPELSAQNLTLRMVGGRSS
jgi:hypothetical protein